MNTERTLQARQAAMQAWLLHGDAGLAGGIDATRAHGATRDDRLRIYADAYRLRMADVLGQDYPVTKAVLGEARFDALADGYLRANPSTRPSVRHFGHAFADWLDSRREVPRTIGDLARFEWRQGEVFDALDAPVLEIEAIATLPAQAWATLRLQLHPATRLLDLHGNAPALVDAHARGVTLPRLHKRATSHWLLWRSAGDVHWRQLEIDEDEALHAVQSREPFSRLCERLDALTAGGGALRAAGLLKRWIADGVLAADVFHSLPN